MKRLFEKIFKKETSLKYIIPEYQPTAANSIRTAHKITEYDLGEQNKIDEQNINKAHRSTN